jgi:hypothetical protein
MALRDAWTVPLPQPPIDLLIRADGRATIKSGYSPGNIAGLSLNWPAEVKAVITEAGLHGVMFLRGMNTVDRQSGLWHLNNLDPLSLAVRFLEGESRQLDRGIVVEILGLNGGTREVPVVNPGEREVLVRRVLTLLGEDERKPGGLTIKMLRKFLDKPCPSEITPEYKTKVKI